MPTFRPHAPRWTHEEALDAGARFVVTFHRRPTQSDTLGEDLPYWETIARLFGSFAAYVALLPAPPVARLARRRCLRCDTFFQPAHKDLHLCKPCKADPDFQTSAAWLGTPVRVRQGRGQ